jgi:hypothetical protein
MHVSRPIARAARDLRATIMRERVRECLDIPWRTDPCTGFNYSGADTY